MRIDFNEANKEYDSHRGQLCSDHDWAVETFNGSKTGDLRCRKCGATIPAQEYAQQEKTRQNAGE